MGQKTQRGPFTCHLVKMGSHGNTIRKLLQLLPRVQLSEGKREKHTDRQAGETGRREGPMATVSKVAIQRSFFPLEIWKH